MIIFYTLTHQTNLGKCLWLLTVSVGFFAAGYFIHDAYPESLTQPVSSSTSTHPIGEFDFPLVTVVPPKDSYTALNYDLMTADNDSLTEENREILKTNATAIFVEQDYSEFLKEFLSISNAKQVYYGFQKIIKLSFESGLEMVVWNNSGSVQTPWFGESYREDFYKEDKHA